MADSAAPTDSDSAAHLSDFELTGATATPGQPHLLKRVAQNLAAAIGKPFLKKAKTVDENADILIIKVEDYVDHRYDRLGRSGMRFRATYIDPDTRSISFRGIGTYRMYFSHSHLALYIEKKAFVPPSDDEDDGPRPSVPLREMVLRVKSRRLKHRMGMSTMRGNWAMVSGLIAIYLISTSANISFTRKKLS